MINNFSLRRQKIEPATNIDDQRKRLWLMPLNIWYIKKLFKKTGFTKEEIYQALYDGKLSQKYCYKFIHTEGITCLYGPFFRKKS